MPFLKFLFFCRPGWRSGPGGLAGLQKVKVKAPTVVKIKSGAPLVQDAKPLAALGRKQRFCFRWGVRWGTRVAGNGLRRKGTDGCPSLLGLSQGVGVAWGSNAVCYHLLFREIGP